MFLFGLLLYFPWNFAFLCVSNHVSTAPEFVFLTCPHLCLCARPPFCQQGSWNMFQWIFLIYFNLLICCVYLSLHLPFSNKEAGTCLDEGNFTTSNSFTSKYLKGQLGIGTPCESRKSVCNVFAYSRPASLPPVSWSPPTKTWPGPLWLPQVLDQALRRESTCVGYVRSEQWARFIGILGIIHTWYLSQTPQTCLCKKNCPV